MQEIQGLLNELKSDDWWIRKNTIGKLLAYPEALYAGVLEGWLKKGGDALLRNASMEAFKALGTRSLGSLASLLRDKDADARILAANVLGEIKGEEPFGILAAAFGDPDENVRMAVTEALGKNGDRKAIDILAKALDDVPWVAMAAIEALGKIGGDAALTILHGCLRKDEYLGMTITALEHSGDRRSLEYIRPYIEDGEKRGPTLKAVVSIAQREKIRLEPSYLAGMVPVLLDLLSSAWDEVRKSAFIALSWSGDKRGVPYFIGALNDDSLQEYAINGLVALGDKAVPEMVEALKKDGSNRVIVAKTLSFCGAFRELLAFASDDNPEVRTEVALAAGELRDPGAEAVLLKLRGDPAEEVSAAARQALRKFGEGGL
jgi:HEAT repeat protein